jgi:hypothetical protein
MNGAQIEVEYVAQSMAALAAFGLPATFKKRKEGQYDWDEGSVTPGKLTYSLQVLLSREQEKRGGMVYSERGSLNLFTVLPAGVPVPEEGDEFTVRAEVWYVNQITPRGTGNVLAYSLSLTRNAAA